MTRGARHWRPQPLWLPVGLLLGAASGAVVGGTVLGALELASSTDLATAGSAGAFGAFFGSIWGGATGVLVGTVMTVLVGSHLPREEARARAYVAGTLATTVTLGLTTAPLWDSTLLTASVLVPGVAVSGPLCRWVAGFAPPRPRPS